jgi:hypothetical protein
MRDPAGKSRDSDSTPALAARIGLFALSTPLQWFMTLVAVMLIGAGAVLLVAAWQAGPEVALRHRAYGHLTASVNARVVESWVAIELDPAAVKSPDFWRASARASPCVVVEIEGDWSAGRSQAFCGNRFPFNDAYDVVSLRQLAPGVPFVWQRDDRGFAVAQVRMSAAARDFLASHAVDTFMHRAWPARNALDWLELELDQPVDAAVIGWTAPPPTMKVVFDPQHADVLLPAGIVATRDAERASWVVPALAAVMGLGIWIAGMQLLPALGNFNALGRVIMTVVPLLALPWWAEYVPRGLATFNAPVGAMIGDMLEELDPLDRLRATTPDSATLAHGVRLTWRAGDGVYADTFGRFRFVPPRSALASDDDALAALARSVTEQMRALDPGEQVRLLDAWRRNKQADLVASGIVAVPVARDALLDPTVDPRVRAAARAFLIEWTTSPTDTPDPHRPAFHQRVAIEASLADVPVPEIANMARAATEARAHR